MKVTINQLQEQMQCCRLMFKYIMGSAQTYSEDYIKQQAEITLGSYGMEMYNDCREAVKTTIPNFEFNTFNLVN